VVPDAFSRVRGAWTTARAPRAVVFVLWAVAHGPRAVRRAGFFSAAAFFPIGGGGGGWAR
jgi:hypothetical protein